MGKGSEYSDLVGPLWAVDRPDHSAHGMHLLSPWARQMESEAKAIDFVLHFLHDPGYIVQGAVTFTTHVGPPQPTITCTLA